MPYTPSFVSARCGTHCRFLVLYGLSLLIASACGVDAPQSTASASAPADYLSGPDFIIGDDPSHGLPLAVVIDATATTVGAIWVLDGTRDAYRLVNPQLRLFDSSGKFVRSVGRVGDGPGEFRHPDRLAAFPDGRVALRDYDLPGRITIYQPDGDLDTVIELGRSVRWGTRAAHALEVDTESVMWIPFRSNRPGPYSAPPPTFLLVRSDGTILDTIPFPTLPEVPVPSVRSVPRAPSGAAATIGTALPFAPRPLWVWGPIGAFATARSDDYQVHLTFPTSVSRAVTPSARTVNVPRSGRIPIPESERAESTARLDRAVAQQVSEWKQPLKQLFFSSEGHLIVHRASPSHYRGGRWVEDRTFEIFSSSGRRLDGFVVPDSIVPLRFVGSHMLAIARRTTGEEVLVRYTIHLKDREQ